jgi:hypothetical protein
VVAGSLGRQNEARDRRGSQPVTKPWITTPTTLDTIQYRARPLGKVVVKNPNISGIIQSIIRLVDACLGSALGMVVIFCMSHMETPTRTGNSGVRSGSARFSHRKELSRGITRCTCGSQE